ncbi:hypothetical protein [Aquimarina sediminis]|uniref:hypothetical protein n=1 Tax=Aquimarina sediminis TaxID=2070536 RepID=UPI000CA035A5|nr:hypothetical protein [Aquimarina sediminis]
MRRVIVDYKKLNKNILNLLVEKFPDGYNDNDIISFRNQHNEAIEAVEVKTEDTIYLVKISKRLADTMQNFEDDDEDDNDNTTAEIPVPVDSEDINGNDK